MTLEQASILLGGDELFGEIPVNKLLVYADRLGAEIGTSYIVIPNWPDTYWKKFIAYPHSKLIPVYVERHISRPWISMPIYALHSDRWMALTLDELIAYNNGEHK